MRTIINDIKTIWSKNKKFLPEYIGYILTKCVCVCIVLPVGLTIYLWDLAQDSKTLKRIGDTLVAPFRWIVLIVDNWKEDLVDRFRLSTMDVADEHE